MDVAQPRLDPVEFRADAATPQTPPGMLRGTLIVAAPGVYKFANASGKMWREYVPPAVLADPEYRASLAQLPLTLAHPTPDMLGDQVVTPHNAREWTIGSTGPGEVRADGALQAPALIWDARGIEASRTTHKQVSAGYTAAYDFTPGTTPDGQIYDIKQIKRTANHNALVPNGLHGAAATFRADAADWAFRVDDDKTGVTTMAKLKIGTVEYEIPDAVAAPIAAHIDGLAVRADAAPAEKTRADTAEAERDAARSEVEALKAAHVAELATVRADAMPQARARIALETQCAAICGKDWKSDGKTDLQCRADALKALNVEIPAARADSADYVTARFDAAVEAASKRTTGDLLAAGMNTQVRADGAKPDDELANARKARDEYNRRMRG